MTVLYLPRTQAALQEASESVVKGSMFLKQFIFWATVYFILKNRKMPLVKLLLPPPSFSFLLHPPLSPPAPSASPAPPPFIYKKKEKYFSAYKREIINPVFPFPG